MTANGHELGAHNGGAHGVEVPHSAARSPEVYVPSRQPVQFADLAPADMLRHHGDSEAQDGLTNLAVNVRAGTPPWWVQEAILSALPSVTQYPNPDAARAALAHLHQVASTHVLMTNGATEAFTLLARAYRPRDMGPVVMVHPQFSEPERALIAAGHEVRHVLCRPETGFALEPGEIPESAKMVFIGNPTNPTGVLHPAQLILSLLRPGRVVVVDEAFMDTVPGEKQSVIPHQLPGLVVVRSLTKSWSIPGLRVGYTVGDPAVIGAMSGQQPPWAVNSLALAAATACASFHAQKEIEVLAKRVQSEVSLLTSGLRMVSDDFFGVYVPVMSVTPFVLAKVSFGESRRRQMRAKGWAIRGCASFPGLGEDWWRITVRENDTTVRFLADLKSLLAPQQSSTTAL